ncbi:hypothetical protein [Streptococcus sp. 3705]|uniref:hypothetical protein n=1 Tax=Streptococcus sp. 3705 TaxID=2582651 RepID=UPI001563C576|nr:hypothetical protein [Streptococcus sp. 3705]
MRQTNVRGSLSLRGFRKLRTGAIVATGVILLGLGFLAPTVSASEQDGVWVARTVEEVKADLQKEGDLFKYVIKWGDTLSVISEASNIPVDVLQEMNQASGKNLFLPHNELYFTEAETVSDTVTKHKIVIKESGASGEVRTYEVLLKKDQETKAVTFELTDVTEKVEKMTMNYSPVYQPVSAPVVERSEELGEEPASEAPAETSPEVKEETEAPVAPKAEEAATTPAPKVEEPATSEPKSDEPMTPAPKAEEPTESSEPKTEASTTPENKEEQPGATEATEPEITESEVAKPSEPKAEASGTSAETTPKEDATEGKVEAPKVEEPEASAEPTEPAPVVEEGTSGEQDQPAEETPAPSKPETPASTAEVAKEAEGTEPEMVTPAEPKAETPAESTESKATEPEVAKPAESNAEAATESTEASGTSAESTPDGTVDSAPAPKETEEAGATAEETPAPKENKTEGTTPGATAEAGETTGEASGTAGESTEPKDSVESTPEGTGSEEAGATGEASTGSTEAKATDPEVAPKEAEEPGTSEITEPATTAPAADSTSEDTNESKSEKPVAEETPVTEEQPATDTDSSAETSNSADSSPSTGSTATEGPTDTTGNTSNNSSTDATTDGNSNDSTSNEENSQDDEPAVEHQDSEKSLEEDTKNSNKAAIDDHKKLAEEAISTSDLDDTQKQEARDRLNELTNLYYKKLEEEKDFEKQTQLVDEYETLSQSIQTPGATIEGAADYTKPIESHAGGTTIDENSTVANSALTSSNPSSQPSSSEDSPQAQPAATSDSSTTGDSGFRSAGTYQPRVTRRRRSIEEPQNTVSIYYNFDGMKDIPGFFGDPGEKNDIEIPKDASGEKVKSLIKEKIDAKKSELAKRGYQFSEDIFVEYTHQDATHYDYVVTFTKQATGTTGFRNAPAVQPRASRNRRSLEQPAPQKVKVNVFYNFDKMKDIAGFLGYIDGTSLEIVEGSTNEQQVKVAVQNQVEAKKEELRKRGYTFKEDYVYQANGKDYNYVVTFSKATK